jgi:hypothetical protein
MDDKIKKAKEQLKLLIGCPVWLRGVGIGKDAAGHFIKVNVSDISKIIDLPSEIFGVRVKADFVGDIQAQSLNTFVDEFVRLAKKKPRKGHKWRKLPKGWSAKSRKKYYESIGGFDECMEKMKDKMDEPGAFCASLKDRATRSTKWRKGKKKKKKA